MKLLRRGKLSGVLHPSRPWVRIFSQQDGITVNVTVEIAKILKRRVVETDWMAVPERKRCILVPHVICMYDEAIAEANGEEEAPMSELLLLGHATYVGDRTEFQNETALIQLLDIDTVRAWFDNYPKIRGWHHLPAKDWKLDDD